MFSLPCLYVLARWQWPLAVPIWTKAVFGCLLLAASQFHFWNKLSSGSVFAPEFARPVVIAFNWAFGAILLLAVFQFLLDIAWLASLPLRRGSIQYLDRARFGIGGIAAALSAIGVANALGVPHVKDVEIPIAGLPQQFDGYRIIQLTDLHITRLFPRTWTQQVVERTNGAGADLIVVTGDVIDGTVAMRRGDVAPLRALKAPDGVYAIPGNHEYYFDYDQWMQHLKGLGMTMLPNSHAEIKRDGGTLVLAGLTDLSALETGHAGPNLDAALMGVPSKETVILLDHHPLRAPDAARRGVDLQLSGHTHGGMIRGLDWIVARANNGFVSGRYEVAGMPLYVSNGTALWAGFALRLGVPSEITRITLRRPSNSHSRL